MKNILESLNWRYATKKFDETKKLSAEQIQTIEEVLRLTPSSFGLQPWKFVILENQEIKESLVAHSYGQAQVSQASHLIVLCRPNTLDASLVENYIADTITATGAPAEVLQGYKDMMLGFVTNMPQSAMEVWAEKQIYIALGNIMTALATLEIDACPMEGFSKVDYDRILGLQEKGLSSVVILPIGYRSADDHAAARPKVRYATADICIKM